ncbi:MAG TPA: hypothetical protein VN285_01535, partial [Candidatus Deferrimicrobium sp.]|nr:hypothetical protein [Candidatus Deferrimicrobium sp.]
FAPASARPQPADRRSRTAGSSVDKFIDEFKKEVEKLRSDELESVKLEADSARPGHPAAGSRVWEESTESASPDQVSLFARQMCSELADRIAEKIVARLDAGQLTQLMRDEIRSLLTAKSPKKGRSA